jgi:hypothetical protein
LLPLPLPLPPPLAPCPPLVPCPLWLLGCCACVAAGSSSQLSWQLLCVGALWGEKCAASRKAAAQPLLPALPLLPVLPLVLLLVALALQCATTGLLRNKQQAASKPCTNQYTILQIQAQAKVSQVVRSRLRFRSLPPLRPQSPRFGFLAPQA